MTPWHPTPIRPPSPAVVAAVIAASLRIEAAELAAAGKPLPDETRKRLGLGPEPEKDPR